MKYTLYSLNDWLEGEEDLEVIRRDYYRARYGQPPPADAPKLLEIDVPDRRRLPRMTTDQLQNLVVILIVMFFIIVLFGIRK